MPVLRAIARCGHQGGRLMTDQIPWAEAWAALPRREHLERHILPDHRRVFLLLTEALTHVEIVERLGPGFTARYVEGAASRIYDRLNCPSKSGSLARLRVLRIALGMDPCWCES